MQMTHVEPRTRSDQFEAVCAIIERHGRQPAKLIPILQAVQDEYTYLPEEVLNYVATALAIPPARVFGVATFYTYFALAPKGKYVVRLCDGTACHVKDSIPILEALRSKLNLSEERRTTPDMLFTVETVACLGACGLAPVVMLNGEVHSLMTPAKAESLIDDLKQAEAAAVAEEEG